MEPVNGATRIAIFVESHGSSLRYHCDDLPIQWLPDERILWRRSQYFEVSCGSTKQIGLMCTVTWRLNQDGYDVFFNRDERRTRSPERPPAVLGDASRRYLAPTDGDHFGTWLAVNECGFTFALLNHYQKDQPTDHSLDRYVSRGELVVQMAHKAIEPIEESLRFLFPSLHSFRPFYLIAFSPQDSPYCWIWDGKKLVEKQLIDSDCPISTSSYRPEQVIAARREAYRTLGDAPTVEQLRDYHRGISSKGAAYGVRMCRGDAQTMSLSHIHVGRKELRFDYQREARDDRPKAVAPPLILARRHV